MATFPSLQPSSRTYTPGDYPNTPYKAWDGSEGRVRHSNVMLESTLRLAFNGLTETQMLDILTHYQTQRGGFESFALPSAVWSGVSSVNDYQLTSYRWCYSEPPTVADLPCGNHNVELSLVTVPPEGVGVEGLNRIVPFTLSGGAVVVSNGMDKTIGWSFAPGLGDAPVNATGIESAITLSIEGGAATGGAAVNGLTKTIGLSITSVSSLDVGFGLTGLTEDDLLNLGF